MKPHKEPKPADALQLLVQLGAEHSAVDLRRKASSMALRELQVAALEKLGEAVPESYVALLKISNGAQINGAYLKEAENLVPENLDAGHSEVIILGDDGLAWYVFDKRDRNYHMVTLGFPEERLATYISFEELLLGILRDQQVI